MNNDLPEAFTTPFIIDNYDLVFDAGDALNGSLYLGVNRGGDRPQSALAALRSAGLWSSAEEKQIGDDQRGAYKDGLEFVACAVYRDVDRQLLLARFDHPKFPSDAGRWAAWLELFDGLYERAR